MADLMLAQRTLVGKVCSNRVWEDDTSVGDKEGWGRLDAQGAQRRLIIVSERPLRSAPGGSGRATG